MFRNWDTAVSVDLHEVYGIDTLDSAIARRPWWWLRARVLGLLDIPTTRLTALLRETK